MAGPETGDHQPVADRTSPRGPSSSAAPSSKAARIERHPHRPPRPGAAERRRRGTTESSAGAPSTSGRAGRHWATRTRPGWCCAACRQARGVELVASTTSTPRPRNAEPAAARIAASRLAGPSAPGCAGRAHRAGHHQRRGRGPEQVEQERRLLDRVGALHHHHPVGAAGGVPAARAGRRTPDRRWAIGGSPAGRPRRQGRATRPPAPRPARHADGAGVRRAG